MKKGNHKKAIEKYSESLSFSNLESATYSNRYLPPAAGRVLQTAAIPFRNLPAACRGLFLPGI